MKKASEILAKLLDENSRGKAQSYASVFRDWRDVAGLSLADHSRVYEIRHNSLFVEVDHNGWMQMLFLRKGRILGNLQRKFPELEIRDIKVRISPTLGAAREQSQGASGAHEASGGAGEASAMQRGALAEDSAGQAAPGGGELEQVLAGVEDDSLRRRLRELFLSSLRSRRRRP